ncbi:MAG: hypothetical protein AAGE94_22425, partial [Acidobacteriota bacterium]
PITLDLSAWYASTGLVGVATVALLTVLAAYYAAAPRFVTRQPSPSSDRRSGSDVWSSVNRSG